MVKGLGFASGEGPALRRCLGSMATMSNKNALLIDRSELRVSNLAKPVDLGKKFDLVESLEVAEHLASISSERFY